MDNDISKTMHKIGVCDAKTYTYTTDEVFTVIAALAAAEVEGVYSLADYSSSEMIAKAGQKALSKSIRLDFQETALIVNLSVNISFGYTVPEVCAKVQDKVSSAISNMIGYSVAAVNVKIADVIMK